MQAQVRYHIKHQGNWLYKISNEEDKQNFRITKFKIPDQLRDEVAKEAVKIDIVQNSDVSEVEKGLPKRLGGKFELISQTAFLEDR